MTHSHVRRFRARRIGIAAGLGIALMAAIAGVAAPIATAAPAGPVAEWTFDEASGTTVQDAIGNLDGTLSGGVTRLSSGAKQGTGALHFDGIDDLVTIANGAALEPSSVTILAWVRATAANSYAPIAEKGSADCDGGSWSLYLNTPGDPYVVGSIHGTTDQPGDGTAAVSNSNGAVLGDGAWHLIGFSYDAAANKQHVFVDGRDEAVTGSALGYGEPLGDNLTLGGSVGSCWWISHLSGDLDDVRVYNRAVPASEILAMLPSVATTTTVNWPANPIGQNVGWQLDATISPAPGAIGAASLYRLENGSPVKVTENGVDAVTGKAYFNVGGSTLPAGDYEMYVTFEGSGMWNASESAHHVVQIRRLPNPITLDASRTTLYPGQTLTLTATTADYSESIALWDAVDGADPVLVDTKVPTYAGQNHYSASFTPSPTLGTHVYTAVTAENVAFDEATSAPKTVVATKRPTTVSVSPAGTPEANHPFTIYVAVIASNPIESATDATGNLTLWDGATQIGSPQPAVSGGAQWDVPSFSLGSHTLHATYDGDATYEGSNGQTVLQILTDVVEASGVGVSSASLYPYKDGYRDTVAIRGTRNEPASVAIRITSPTGKLVRTFAVAKASGGYSVGWNGTAATGGALAGGKYKVVQTLTDGAGTHLAVTSYVTISTKRLSTSTTYINQLGSAYVAKGSGGGGSVVRSTSAGTVQLIAGKSGSGYAVAGWELVLPSATVYKSITWQVYAKYVQSTSPTGIGMQNFSQCARSSNWNDGCFDRWRGIGNSGSAAWYSTSGSVVTNRSGRYVRGIVEGVFMTTTVYKVRIKVTYAILK